MNKIKFHHEYRLTQEWYDYRRHLWFVSSAQGAVHLHITELNRNSNEYAEEDQYSAGLEIHHRNPPPHMNNRPPSRNTCFILGGPCWHEGQSSYAQETLLPRWLYDKNGHTRMFKQLECEYLEHFGFEEDSEL